jgi:NAD+ diphosphatase
MNFAHFPTPAAEPSSMVGFAGNRIDRQSENRTDDALAHALADPATRFVLVRDGRVIVAFEDDAAPRARFDLDEANGLGADMAEAILLGRGPHGPVAAAVVAVEIEALPERLKAIDYRSVYTQGLLDAEALGELAQAAALIAWNANHRHCGRCGAPTMPRIGGYKRSCTGCGADHFPRTDPVAIMLAVRGERCLLGRSPHFRPGMYSCLAGFIEPGETIENAVRRETLEESGITIGRVAYHASQPWPFPYSLMIGCYGEALDETVAFDGRELEDCRWFDRGEVASMLGATHSGELVLPPAGAIAHHLIRHWLEHFR